MKKRYDPELIKDDLRKLIQQTLKEALEAELEDFLGYSKYQRTNSNNSRNGYISKTVKTAAGEVEIETPRDRKGDFEPKIVKKRQTVLEDLENKVIALYSKGMTVRDIQELLSDMYGMDISPSLISKITDKLTPRIEEWQSRPLERIYVILYIDCIFYKVRQDGKVVDKAVYVVIGINKEGRKELLGFWINETESASFWFKVLNDIKSRGVKDVLIFSVDNLSGIEKAIKGVYPQAEIQKCVVHQIRNSLRYVSWKDKKGLSSDLKKVYGAATLEEAELRMDEFEEKWGNKYPHVIKSWRTNWEELMAYFKYPLELRKLMYTTNIIESVNSKFRKVTDGKRVFPSDMSVLKNLYLAALELAKKWNRSVIKDWGIIYGQLSVIFEERLEA
ncbi:IS256 family transposase [Desulfurobacterium thermolithotrophum]|uniref:IS256 family transposase n=1 Tax=Desulfurobacterium thermolithotrophum TaxID=64160 RepID=UPI0013D3B494|nr:IS256 family transposase [Desulfurobacterium thermolithotrophum]